MVSGPTSSLLLPGLHCGFDKRPCMAKPAKPSARAAPEEHAGILRTPSCSVAYLSEGWKCEAPTARMVSATCPQKPLRLPEPTRPTRTVVLGRKSGRRALWVTCFNVKSM